MVEKLKVVEIRSPQPEPLDAADDLAPEQAGPGKRITLHFALSLPDGHEVDSNFGAQPATFEFGDGNLLPGFEARIRGLRAGERASVQLSPGEAFGQVNEDNIQKFPRYQFPADLLLEQGLMVSFTDSAGNEQAGMVVDMDKRNVEVDFNHPLAGREIVFTVEIMAVEAR